MNFSSIVSQNVHLQYTLIPKTIEFENITVSLQLVMDEDCKSTIGKVDNSKDKEVNLPEVVASLKMLAVDKPEEEEVSSPITAQRRSTRKRKPRDLELTNLNRRCSIRPKKRTFAEMESEEQIKEYYLDKSVKKHTNSLETIFEEKEDSSHTTVMSVKRFKRMIQFTAEPTDSKLKKRRDKIKKVFGSKINYKRKRKVSMQALLDKLSGLNNDISLNNLNEVKG